MGVPTPRDPVRQGRAIEERLAIVENRAGIPARLSDSGSGSTAERDIYYTVPSTDAERAGLANRVPTWFNTDKGYSEGYYATTGLAGLTARGLVADPNIPTGWYPLAGSLLIATRIKSSGFQSLSPGVVTYPTLTVVLQNIGGFTSPGVSDLVPPNAGYFTVTSGAYWSGGAAMTYRNSLVRYGGGGAEINAARIPNTGADGQIGTSAPGVLVKAAQSVELAMASAAADNIYGDGINRRTFLTLSYDGPPVVNG